MIINTYKRYLLNKFIKKKMLVSFIFLILVLIINFIEESNFLKDSNSEIYVPLLLTLLNAPSLLLEIFPFIFLISTQLFFLDLFENQEILSLRQFGISNFQILKFTTFISFIISLLIMIIFYNFSSIVKNEYLKIKNQFTKDNKYLAVITKNGLWIKDSQINGETLIINSKKIQNQFLIDTTITKFDKNFIMIENIIADRIDIKNNNWKLFNVTKTENDNSSVIYKEYLVNTKFNIDKINNLFSDLSSLTFFGLLKLEDNYKTIGYSVDEIILKKNKYFSNIFFMSIMSIIGALLVLKTNLSKKIFLNIFIGIFISVIVYYFLNFFSLLAKNEFMTIQLSVWFPIIFLVIISLIPAIKINEI